MVSNSRTVSWHLAASLASVRAAVERQVVDPWPRRARRIAVVLPRMLGPLRMLGLPRVVEVALRHGVGPHTIHALRAAIHPGLLALVDEHRQLTYGELDNEINVLAHRLVDRHGVSKGTPVVLMMENRAEYLVAWFALFRLGALTVHAPYRATVDELAYLVEHSGAHLVISSEAHVAVADRLADECPGLHLQTWVADRPPGVDAAIGELSSAFPAGGSRQSQTVVYTSGTTGKPKGAVRDFASVGARELLRLIERLPFAAGDRHLIVAPLYHSGAQAFAVMQAALGATVYVQERFVAEQTLDLLARWQIDSLFLVPTMLHRLVDVAEARIRRRRDDGAVHRPKVIIVGAAEFPQPLRERAIAAFGAEAIYEFYGATELGWVTLVSGEEMQMRKGTVGRAVPGTQIRIFDEHGARLPAGAVGRIHVRNEQSMVGYLHDADATAVGRRGPWATVDDLGYLDDDGYLYLAGRARDMVISGGVNIYPVEIEEVLVTHPQVREVAVVGIPDDEWGERLIAAVVPEGPAIDLQELEGFARERLSSYKVPKVYSVLAALPRNPTGKVLKGQLRERFSLEQAGAEAARGAPGAD